MGVASLAAWRDRLPRRVGPPVPRALANYSLLQEDPELIFLRGRFPLASRVNIPGGYDIVAVLPNTGVVRGIGDSAPTHRSSSASSGPEPFVLLNDNAALSGAGVRAAARSGRVVAGQRRRFIASDAASAPTASTPPAPKAIANERGVLTPP